ncbi:MAG TPA: protein kinase [Pyrinomonadaceae bacterium]|jgi:serine/threonine-protein kinase
MTLAEGTRLGRYEIRSQLGVGGMGEVYLARDTSLARQVAIKILPPELAANQKRMQRFNQEAQAASSLNHPNILTIHEVEQSGPTPFIATEYIDGLTLRQLLKEKRLKVEEALEIACQTASALAAAHEAGVVHRDIKPENIMLRRDGYVKVLDFGLAKLTERMDETSPEAITQVYTDVGSVIGTARYMSPEQARGLEVDGRTDIFSLGIVLYEMLAGRSPFGGGTNHEVVASILKEEPPPLDGYNPEVSERLQAAVLKMLAKDRDQRYQTARELLTDIKSIKQDVEWAIKHGVANASTATDKVASGTGQTEASVITTSERLARPTSSAEYLVEELKRRKKGVIVVLSLLLTLGAVGLLYFAFIRTRQAIDSIAVLPFGNISNDANTEYLTDGLTESLINNLSQLPNLKVIARSSVFRYKGREVDPQVVGRELGVRAVLTGKVVQVGDTLSIQVELVDVANQTQLWGEKFNRQVSDIISLQDELSRDISENLRLRLTGEEKKQLAKRYTENPEAYRLYWKGRYHWNKRRPEDVREAIRNFKQAIDLDPNYALAYTGLADCYILGNLLQLSPKGAMPIAAESARKALSMDNSLAEAHTSLAKIKLSFEWDWPGAESEFRKAIELGPGYATAHQWYGVYLSEMGRHDESLAERNRAQVLDPLSLSIRTGLCRAYYWARRYDESLTHLQTTLEKDPQYADTHWSYGLVYEQKKMTAEAIAAFQKAIDLSRTAEFPEGKPEMIAALGHAYAIAGKRSEAEKILEQLNGLIAQQRYVSPYSIALVYAGLGDKDKAFSWIERAYDERDEALVHLKVDPRLDPLRSDSRFQNWLALLKLAS